MKLIPKFQWEETFELFLKATKLPKADREYRFCEGRKWRFDFAWVHKKVAVEIDGVLYTSQVGRHQTALGYKKDCEKLNKAAELGWRVFRYTPEMLKKGAHLEQIPKVLSDP